MNRKGESLVAKQAETGRNVPPSGPVLMDFFEKLSTNDEIFLYHVRQVSDVMRSTAVPVTLDSTMKEIWTEMNSLGLSDLPVVDISGDPRKGTTIYNYVGIIRKRELAALASRFVGALSQHDSDDHMMQVRLSGCDAIDRSVATVTKNASIFDAIEVMLEHHSETIAVVDDNRIYLNNICILDILSCLSYMTKLQRMRITQSTQEVRLVDLFNKRGGSLPSDKMLETFVGYARDVMNEDFISIIASAPLGDAMTLMERAKQHTLIVVDDEGNLKGITNSTEIQLALPPLLRKGGRVMPQTGGIFKTNPEDSEARQSRAEKVTAVTQTGIERVSPEKPVNALITSLMKPTALAIPVLDSGNVIKGIVERWDLAKAFSALGGVLKKQGMA
jgi:CBS-domain-containing membrane protein